MDLFIKFCIGLIIIVIGTFIFILINALIKNANATKRSKKTIKNIYTNGNNIEKKIKNSTILPSNNEIENEGFMWYRRYSQYYVSIISSLHTQKTPYSVVKIQLESIEKRNKITGDITSDEDITKLDEARKYLMSIESQCNSIKKEKEHIETLYQDFKEKEGREKEKAFYKLRHRISIQEGFDINGSYC